MNKILKALYCPTGAKFLLRTGNLRRHLPKCEDLLRNIYQKTVYQLHGSLFDELEGVDFEIVVGKMLLNNLAVFEYESVCAEDSSLIDA